MRCPRPSSPPTRGCSAAQTLYFQTDSVLPADAGVFPDIHMTPAEGMRAHLDLQGGRPHGVLLPIHWGTSNLAPHAWAEPGEWTKDAGEEAGQAVAFPRPGEPFEPAGRLPAEAWWRAVSQPIAHPWRRPRGAESVAETSRGDMDLAGER